MKNNMIITGVLFYFILMSSAFGEEEKEASSKIEVIGKTHTIASSNFFGGAGAEVANLAATYDMSLFEFNLGGKQSKFNGSGITANANYPLTDGEALTNNTQIGLAYHISEEMKTGFLLEEYSLLGDKTVGRVFGEELPWDNFPRNGSGTITPSRFQVDLFNAFLEGKKEDFSYKMVGGSLTGRELPEFTRKEMNQVKLGSLVYRAPITNNSFFEKEDRKIEEGRHPMKGFDFAGNYEYAEHENLHWELFSGSSKPTPISDIDRDAFGGRTAVDLGKGNIGFTYVYNNGLRQNTNVEENQNVWSLDSSYKLFDWLTPYFTFARTDYERENSGESHAGNAYAAGVSFKLLDKYDLKTQYQRLDENYDLMAYHKSEHYPGNSQGPSAQLSVPLSDTLKVKGTFLYAKQLETETTADDTLFGDSFFPSNSGAEKGSIDVERVSVDWKVNERLSLNGYIEHAQFFQDALTPAASIDKDVYNFYGGGSFSLTKKLGLDLGLRHVYSQGDWQAMPFDSYQDIPEAAFSYKISKDQHAYLIYHYYNFEDENIVAQGQNDYYGHQVIFELKIPL